MDTTPVELLPNTNLPDTFYEVDSLLLYYQFGTTGYSVGDIQFVVYGNSTMFRFTRTLLVGNDNRIAIAKAQGLTWNEQNSLEEVRYVNFIPSSNNRMTLVAEGPVTDGDGTLRAVIRYKVRTFGA